MLKRCVVKEKIREEKKKKKKTQEMRVRQSCKRAAKVEIERDHETREMEVLV